MGLLDRLFGRRKMAGDAPSHPQAERPQAATDANRLVVRILPGEEDLEVVGDSHYQQALWSSCGLAPGRRVRHDVVAVLVPEPANPYDENAIRVVIDARTAGYLRRIDAADYLPGLRQLMAEHNAHIALAGVIVGGGTRSDGPGFLGVWLEHQRADFGLQPSRGLATTPPQRPVATATMRTGFSEAWLTDVDDDSYDLS